MESNEEQSIFQFILAQQMQIYFPKPCLGDLGREQKHKMEE